MLKAESVNYVKKMAKADPALLDISEVRGPRFGKDC